MSRRNDVETAVIDMIKLFQPDDGVPSGFSVVHFDGDSGADADRIKVKAEDQGAALTDKEGATIMSRVAVEVMTTLKTQPSGNAAKMDGILEAIDAVINGEIPSTPTSVTSAFDYFRLEPAEAEDERTREDDNNDCVRRFVVICKSA